MAPWTSTRTVLLSTPGGFHTVLGGKAIHCMHLTRDPVVDESRVKFLLPVLEIQEMPKACLAEENAK